MQKKVYVLMSSYNGEKYIKEQVESILNQKKVDLELYVRDDGSMDATVSIVREISRKDGRVHIVEGKNIGAKYSFLELLASVDGGADYYAFSDQDDFWLEHKLYEAIKKIESEGDSSIPVLYYSHTRLVNEKLQLLKKKNNYNKQKAYNFGQILIKNCASGCTMVMNGKLKEKISSRDNNALLPYPLHDHWIYMLCLAIGGKVVFDKNSYILYRQHMGNAVGGQRGMLEKIKTSPLFHEGNQRYHWSRELLLRYGNDLTDENRELLNRILNYQDSIRNTVSLALNPELKPPEIMEKIIVALTILRRRF